MVCDLRHWLVDDLNVSAEDMTDLLWEIFQCPNFDECLRKPRGFGGCTKIVWSQSNPLGSPLLGRYFRPEPWSGDLEKCRILFLSSNPSISSKDQKEEYPTNSDSSEHVTAYFTKRFDPEERWVSADFKYRLADSLEYSKKSVRYWVYTHRLASEILRGELAGSSAKPGEDYAISEVVHCKSQGQHGVIEALCECTHRYLKRILNHTRAEFIVAIGGMAEMGLYDQLKRMKEDGDIILSETKNERITILTRTKDVEQRRRYAIFMPGQREKGSSKLRQQIMHDLPSLPQHNH